MLCVCLICAKKFAEWGREFGVSKELFILEYSQLTMS